MGGPPRSHGGSGVIEAAPVGIPGRLPAVVNNLPLLPNLLLPALLWGVVIEECVAGIESRIAASVPRTVRFVRHLRCRCRRPRR
jgi:hypothetical protein